MILVAASGTLTLLGIACGSSGSKPTNDGTAGVDSSSGGATRGGAGSGGATGAGGAAGVGGATGMAGGAGGESTTGAGGAAGGSCPTCFLHGQWSLDNLSPCFVSGADPTKISAAISTVQSGGAYQCPMDLSAAPAVWSTDRLTIDCAGHYDLCFTLKAGDPSNPSPSDCVVAQSCVAGDAVSSTMPQAWPPLPGWIASQSATACAQSFYDGGGYGEESVTGTANGCGTVSKVFARVRYCPLSCNGPTPASACATCVAGGSGPF